MTGPEQEKLRRGVDGASSGDLLAASDKWGTASLLLRQVADQLAVHASTPREVIGGLTGSATSEAFVRSSKAMGDKSDELNNGSNALLSAGRALSQAESEHSSLGPQPGLESRPPTTPGPSTPETVREQSAYDTYAAGWHADFERREARARQANEQMEAAFRDSSAEMRKIHGQQEKPPIVEEGWPPEGTEPSGGAGGGGAVGTSGGSGHGGGHGGGPRSRDPAAEATRSSGCPATAPPPRPPRPVARPTPAPRRPSAPSARSAATPPPGPPRVAAAPSPAP